MPIRVLIAACHDREKIVLRYLLDQIRAVEIAGEVNNGQEALSFCQDRAIDLLILDVSVSEKEMEDATAILGLHQAPLLALLGAKPELAVRAFELGALDYILKPLELQRLEKTVLRARQLRVDQERFEDMVESRLKERVNLLLERYLQAEKTDDFLAVRSKGKITLLHQQDIVYCESQVKKVNIYTKHEIHPSNFTLNELAEKLNEKSFFRAHPAFIVNLAYVKEILNFAEGSYLLRLQHSDRDIILSRSRAKLLRHKLGI